jgi:hypothetical protein
MSYFAIVAPITVWKHPNADKLQLGKICDCQVVTGLDVKSGDIMLFFPVDGQISEQFAKANDLIRRKDENGNNVGGMFDENRKVRCQKLRGEKSEGFAIPLTSLSFAGDISQLKVGDQFDTFNGVAICNKYETPATKRAQANQQRKIRKYNKMFPQHIDTKQFKYFSDKIKAGSVLQLTWKLHGTSGRFAYVEEPIEYKGIKKLINKILPLKQHNWTEISGTRRVVLDLQPSVTEYYGGDFRERSVSSLRGKLNKNECIYFEVVGYSDLGAPIMPPVSTSKLQDKTIEKQFGKTMTYKYGCADGEHKIFVYRITHVNEDGVQIDLDWESVKKRCATLGVEHVPEVMPAFIYDGDVDKLKKLVEDLIVVRPSVLDQTHIEEGLVIRAGDSMDIELYKAKNFEFLVLEGVAKDNSEYVDMEEAS